MYNVNYLLVSALEKCEFLFLNFFSALYHCRTNIFEILTHFPLFSEILAVKRLPKKKLAD